MDQILRLPGIDMLAAQYAVDQQFQLRILKLPTFQTAAVAAGIDLKACLLQKGQIPADGLSFDGDAVILVQMVNDLVLGQPVLGIRMLLQDLQNADQG